MILAAGLTTQVYGVTVTFQNGVGGYTGYKTATLVQTAPGTVQATGLFTVDGGNGSFNDGQFRHGLFMFDNLFNNDGGPIPIGATINSASMVANFNDNSSTAFSLHRMILSWDPTTATWNSFTAGVQNDGLEAVAAATHTFSNPNGNAVGTYNPYGATLATDISAFATGGTVNNGWVVLPTSGTSGWGHSAAVANSAILTIDYTFGVVKNLVWNTHPAGTWDSGVGANLAWLNGGPTDFFTNGDNATFSQNASPTTVTVAAGGVSPNAFTISNASGEYTFTGAGITGPLAKSGAGSVVFSNTGNSLGNATVSGGSATFDNATTFASLAASGGSMVVLKAANTNAGGTTISGGATMETQITGATGAGSIALDGGTLRATTNDQTQSGGWSLNATNGGTIEVAAGRVLTLSAALATTGTNSTTQTLTKTGSGILALTSAFGGTYRSQNLNVQGGVLRLQHGGNSLSQETILAISAGAFVDASWDDGENMGGISGAGTFVGRNAFTAGGGITLFAASNFSGKITAGTNGIVNGSAVELAASDLTQTGADSRRTDFHVTNGVTVSLTGATSDFAGRVFVDSGTLNFANVVNRGVTGISALGLGNIATTPVTAGSDISLGSGGNAANLNYTGTTANSTDRTININGTGALSIGVTDAAGKLTLTGLISSTATPTSLSKTGPGTLELTNANTYLGPTIVADGTLLANNTTGSATDGGNVTVNAAGTFGGTGAITGSVTVDGKLSPGASIESLATGTVNLNTASTLVYEASPVDANIADLLDITGNLNLSGTVTLDVAGANLADPAWGLTKISIASYTGTWNLGTFSGWADDTAQVFGANSWTINYDDLMAGINFTSEQAGAAGHVTLTQTVPEPSALLSLLGGSALLLARRRRLG